jgi:hypothetical protein
VASTGIRFACDRDESSLLEGTDSPEQRPPRDVVCGEPQSREQLIRNVEWLVGGGEDGDHLALLT